MKLYFPVDSLFNFVLALRNSKSAPGYRAKFCSLTIVSNPRDDYDVKILWLLH